MSNTIEPEVRAGYVYGKVTMAVPRGETSFQLWYQVADHEVNCPLVGGKRWYRGGVYPSPSNLAMLGKEIGPIAPELLAEIAEKNL